MSHDHDRREALSGSTYTDDPATLELLRQIEARQAVHPVPRSLRPGQEGTFSFDEALAHMSAFIEQPTSAILMDWPHLLDAAAVHAVSGDILLRVKRVKPIPVLGVFLPGAHGEERFCLGTLDRRCPARPISIPRDPFFELELHQVPPPLHPVFQRVRSRLAVERG